MVEGELAIRDAEPVAMEHPTSISGTVDTESGAITAGALTTPELSFERPVTELLTATAFIDVTFSPAAPATGSVDSDGRLVLDLGVTVDLHVEVVPEGGTTPIGIPGDCTATPVDLNLRAAEGAPYDPGAGTVTVTDADFTVPALVETDDCADIIVEAINEQLAGPGHRLSLSLQGHLPLPPPPGCDTTTLMAVLPEDTSPLGEAVQLDATVETVAADPECSEAAANGDELAGVVEFYADGDPIASADLDGSGQATVTTTTLSAGVRTLTARYRGLAPFSPSGSNEVGHLVTAPPLITSTLPPYIEVGSGPAEFTIDINATDFTAPVTGAHLDLTATRNPGNNLNPQMISVEIFKDGSWEPVALAAAPSLFTVVGRVSTLDIAPGDVISTRLRVSAGAPNPQTPSTGPLHVAFELVPPGSGLAAAPSPGALVRGTVATTLVGATRTPTTLTLGVLAIPPISPHTARQGQTIVVSPGNVRSTGTGAVPVGFLDVLVDGDPVGIALVSAGLLNPGDQPRIALGGSSNSTPSVMFQLPPNARTGTRQVTVRYSGDAVFEPSQVSVPITVVPAAGTVYECRAESAPPVRFRANVVAQANLPSAIPSGTDVLLDHLAVRVLTDRSGTTTNAFNGLLADNAITQVGDPTLLGVAFGFGPAGSGAATAVSRSFGSRMPNTPNPATADIDQVIDPRGETGTVRVEGAVGEVVPVTLDSIQIETFSNAFPLPVTFLCTPVGGAVELGRVRVSGVEVSVAPAGVSRAGDAVVVTADVGDELAAGVVEFRDGASTIGVVPVSGRTASLSTRRLAVGGHSLSARFFPQPLSAMLESEVVPHTVLPEHDCPDFAAGGNGAVVRLVYLELLGRCPDQAGFDHWTARLDGGASPASFARAIARTPEAVGRVVDDAYETMLGRDPDGPGRAFWVGRLQADGRYDRLLAELGSSEEFWEKAGSTDTGFVTRVYERLLGRAPDGPGLAHWESRLSAGVWRRTLVITLARLDEPLGRIVTSSYGEILDRAPFPGERAEGIVFLRATGDRSGLYAELIGRPEFSTRAQNFPNLDD